MKDCVNFDKEIEKILKEAKEKVRKGKKKTDFANTVFDLLCPDGYIGSIGKLKKALANSIKEGHNYEIVKTAYEGGWFNKEKNGFK